MANLQTHLALTGLRGRRVIEPDVESLVDRVADDICQLARHRVGVAGEFHLALSGGSTPQVLYQHLVIDPRYRAMPWEKTHLWIVDERCVPFDHEKSNYRMINELIVEHVPIGPAHVHPMMVTEDGGDVKYEHDLRAALDNPSANGRLDLVLLGMGPDGHTASLFPQTPGLTETERWIIINDGEAVMAPRPRMTMTYPLINNARHIGLLLTGVSKYDMLKQVAASPDDVQRLPVTGVKPAREDTELTWYLDEAAATGQNPDPDPDDNAKA
ncbi:6-phosphogluconolactonase [Planctomycetales bacterium ZRK34]|nr:6-phosphogluconolactonase [Planctomycetales bacterium ZRK34]